MEVISDMEKIRDLIIIGAGPAGLTAAIYAKRAGFDTLVIDETGMGGGHVQYLSGPVHGAVPEDAEKSVGGAAFDGDDGLEGMVLRGRGRRRAVKLDVSACGEPAPAVERHDHRRIDTQEFACGGERDEIGF